MVRVNQVRKAERLNHARRLLRRMDHLPDAVARMARDCSISPRQAYRYLEEASHLTAPVPIGDEKIAFTVKLSRGAAWWHKFAPMPGANAYH
jgi:predicted DNA-binding transcriptional regulator YafY